MVYFELNKTYTCCNIDIQISARQRLTKHVTTQTTIGETMMECINAWLNCNDKRLLNYTYTNEACINTPPQTSVIPRTFIQK
jgi:hypothetical protein